MLRLSVVRLQARSLASEATTLLERLSYPAWYLLGWLPTHRLAVGFTGWRGWGTDYRLHSEQTSIAASAASSTWRRTTVQRSPAVDGIATARSKPTTFCKKRHEHFRIHRDRSPRENMPRALLAVHGTNVPTMTSMRSQVFDAASDIAELARCAASAREMCDGLLHVLQPLVGFDSAATMSALPAERWSVVGQHLDENLLATNGWRYLLESPTRAVSAFSRGFVRDVDVVEPHVRERAATYREFHRPMGTRVYVARWWVTDGRATMVAMARNSGTFTDRTLYNLDRLFPSVSAAMRASELLPRPADERVFEFSKDYRLSARQREISALVVRGLRNAEIAALLGVATNTVRNSLAEIFRKTKVCTRAELTYLATSYSCGPSECCSRARWLLRRIADGERASPDK
jgi:DNA-binding CsgD family transcriptional regulator